MSAPFSPPVAPGRFGLGDGGGTDRHVPDPDRLRSERDLRPRLAALGGLMAGGVLLAPVFVQIGPLCPLRRLTGVPCPFCGLRGGVTSLAHGDVLGSLQHSPLALLVVIAVVLASASLFRDRVFSRDRFPFGDGVPSVAEARARRGSVGVGGEPAPVSLGSRPWRGHLSDRGQAGLVGLSWLFQLHRYGYIT